MNSRIDELLCLEDNGRTVKVTGPILSWAPGEVSALIAVVITQVKASTKTAMAGGISERYMNGAANWDADAIVTSGPALEFGPATAYATATIEMDDRTFKQYNWTVQTRLVRCEDGQPVQGDGE
jgi:hypothetical protein